METENSTSNNFAAGAIDTAGNLYAVWATANTADPNHPQVLYYAHSTDTLSRDSRTTCPLRGKTWSAPLAITALNGSALADITAADFPSIAVGDPGRVDIAFYGTTHALPYDPAHESADWNVFFAQSLDGLATRPAFSAVRVTEQPNHRQPICTGGLGACGATGNLNLLDFFEVQVDSVGRANIVFSDDNNSAPAISPGGPIVEFVQQASGPGVYAYRGDDGAGNIRRPAPSLMQSVGLRCSVNDPTADARYPAHGPSVGPNNDAADITAVKLSRKDAATLKIVISVAQTPLVPTSAIVSNPTVGLHTSATWVVTWHSDNDVFFAAATTDATGQQRFTAGRPAVELMAVPAKFPQVFSYGRVPSFSEAVSGSFALATGEIEIDVPYSAVGDPADDAILRSVQGFSFVGNGLGEFIAPLQDQIDATAPIDFRMGAG